MDDGTRFRRKLSKLKKADVIHLTDRKRLRSTCHSVSSLIISPTVFFTSPLSLMALLIVKCAAYRVYSYIREMNDFNIFEYDVHDR